MAAVVAIVPAAITGYVTLEVNNNNDKETSSIAKVDPFKRLVTIKSSARNASIYLDDPVSEFTVKRNDNKPKIVVSEDGNIRISKSENESYLPDNAEDTKVVVEKQAILINDNVGTVKFENLFEIKTDRNIVYGYYGSGPFNPVESPEIVVSTSRPANLSRLGSNIKDGRWWLRLDSK